MEQLKGIRRRTKTWNKQTSRMIASWNFYQLQQYVESKAYYFGLKFEQVNPAYTSQTCRLCGKQGNRTRARLTCAAWARRGQTTTLHVCLLQVGASVNRPESAAKAPAESSSPSGARGVYQKAKKKAPRFSHGDEFLKLFLIIFPKRI